MHISKEEELQRDIKEQIQVIDKIMSPEEIDLIIKSLKSNFLF